MAKEYFFTKGGIPFQFFYYGKIIKAIGKQEIEGFEIIGVNWDANVGLDFGKFVVPTREKYFKNEMNQFDVDRDVAQHQTIRYILGEIK